MLDLYAEFESIVARFNDEAIEYALCGGLALAIYTPPRATVDIDILIERASLDNVKHVLQSLGYTVEALPMRFGTNTEIHRLSKIDPLDGDLLSVDLLLVTDPNRPAWDTRFEVDWQKKRLSIVSRDGLVLLKSFRGSQQDQVDIKRLRENETSD